MKQTVRKISVLAVLLFSFVHSKAQPALDTVPFVCYFPMYEVPSFPGGNDSLKSYIRKNLKWPAPDWCGEGTVYVKFKVDCKGAISKATVLRGIDSLANKEALRLINQMPKWINGDCKTFPEGMWFNLPLKFR